ncbi:MAG: Hsp20/alpha crystallin family protein [Armatimonadetes bacterium]|nr:Hsp20/alpha crystallin family protein [Armatimonadota bacterium]
MGILRWDPFADMVSLRDQINRVFDESMRQDAGRREAAPARAWPPAVDVLEDADSIVIKADLPGLKQDDIHIDLTGDTLTLKGERRFEEEQKRENYLRIERTYGTFQRSFQLGVPVDADKVKASYQDGALTITLPKAEAIKPHRVEITTGNAGPKAVETK